MQDPVQTDSTELLRTLIRNACVNDGDVASGRKVRNVDALEAYFALVHGVTTVRGYTGVGLGTGFRELVTTIGLRTPDGHRPRIHDLRHTFAVHALARWYQTGADVQVKLPLLATYMGHVSIVSTAYYLPFFESLRTLATARFAQRYSALLAAGPTRRERRR